MVKFLTAYYIVYIHITEIIFKRLYIGTVVNSSVDDPLGLENMS